MTEIPKRVQCYYLSRKEFRNKYQVMGELYQAIYPGELYLIDRQKMDVLVLVNPRRDKIAKHPWIPAVLDQYSRLLVGYYIYDSTRCEFRQINRLVKQAESVRKANNHPVLSLSVFEATSKLLLNV